MCAGRYAAVHIPAFEAPIPVVTLYGSYQFQVQRGGRTDPMDHRPSVTELINIDSWLSICGRTKEITEGPNALLRQIPAMVQLIVAEFELDFTNLQESADQGGLEDIQGLAANLLDFLADEELTDAELTYVLVATIGAAKVVQCMVSGSNTDMLEPIFFKDVQAHLV